jgi:hypothetical protein
MKYSLVRIEPYTYEIMSKKCVAFFLRFVSFVSASLEYLKCKRNCSQGSGYSAGELWEDEAGVKKVKNVVELNVVAACFGMRVKLFARLLERFFASWTTVKQDVTSLPTAQHPSDFYDYYPLRPILTKLYEYIRFDQHCVKRNSGTKEKPDQFSINTVFFVGNSPRRRKNWTNMFISNSI